MIFRYLTLKIKLTIIKWWKANICDRCPYEEYEEHKTKV